MTTNESNNEQSEFGSPTSMPPEHWDEEAKKNLGFVNAGQLTRPFVRLDLGSVDAEKPEEITEGKPFYDSID